MSCPSSNRSCSASAVRMYWRKPLAWASTALPAAVRAGVRPASASTTSPTRLTAMPTGAASAGGGSAARSAIPRRWRGTGRGCESRRGSGPAGAGTSRPGSRRRRARPAPWPSARRTTSSATTAAPGHRTGTTRRRAPARTSAAPPARRPASPAASPATRTSAPAPARRSAGARAPPGPRCSRSRPARWPVRRAACRAGPAAGPPVAGTAPPPARPHQRHLLLDPARRRRETWCLAGKATAAPAVADQPADTCQPGQQDESGQRAGERRRRQRAPQRPGLLEVRSGRGDRPGRLRSGDLVAGDPQVATGQAACGPAKHACWVGVAGPTTVADAAPIGTAQSAPIAFQ